MKQNQNIETSKHIEKLAKLIKITEASKDLIRSICTDRDSAELFGPEIKKLRDILDMPKKYPLDNNTWCYYLKEDAIEEGFKDSIHWDDKICKWIVD